MYIGLSLNKRVSSRVRKGKEGDVLAVRANIEEELQVLSFSVPSAFVNFPSDSAENSHTLSRKSSQNPM